VVLVVAACGGGGGSGADAPPCLCDAPNGDGAGAHWQPRAALPVELQETAALAVDGQVFVLGGFEGLAVTAHARIYDVAGDGWSLAPDLPAAVHHANAALVGGTMYVVGDLQTFNFTPVGDVWAYNPETDADWSTRPAMPRPRGASVTGVIDDVIYVAGGLAGGAVDLVDSYEPSTGTWTELAPLPAPRDHACGAAINGILYVAGGRTGSPDGPVPTVYAYDPSANQWTEKAPMPTGRGGTACGVIDNKLIVVGGEGNDADPSGVFPQTELYDPATDTWSTHEPMLHPRHGMQAAVWNDQLFVPGGADVQAFGAVSTHDVFTP
jgi:N-acetylneuraminic acid mutarotase